MKKAKKLSLIILAIMFALSVALLTACAPTKYELLLNDGLGNANSVQTTEINKDEEFTLPQMTQSKTGYVFDGWKRGSDGTVFNAGETVKITGHTSFAAQWKGNSYTIVFHYEQDSSITSEQKMTYGTAALLNQNQFTKTGFDFAGWQDEDGNTYTDKQQVNNLTPEKNGTFDLWAIWEVKKYDLTLVFDNGEENLTTKYAFEADISGITDPDKEGYTFAGWYESETFEGDEYLLGTMPANNMTLFAKWEINSYDITFVLNNGEANKVVSYDFGAETAEITRPEKVGFTFGGWYDNAECTGTPYVFGTMPAKNVTLYAKWNINSYTITFVDGSEALSSSDYQYGEMPVAPKMPSQKIIDERTIAVFKGWSPAVVAATATQTYTAVWKNQTRLYGITFEENEFVEFLSTDGDTITSATREFEQSFSFKIKNLAGVNPQNVSVFSNGAKLTPDENGVYTSPFAENTLITVEGVFVEYKLNFTASNATYTTDMPEKLTYGSVITVFAVGDKWYTDNAPTVTYAGQKIESTSKQTVEGVEYHVFPITVDKNGTISISGVKDVVPVTFVDLNGQETNADWNISYGPIGMNDEPYYVNTWKDYLLDGTNKLYKATSVYDASYNTFVAMTTDTSKQFVEKDEAEAIAQSLADTHLYPTKGGENKYYVVYYYIGEQETSTEYQATVGFMSPIGSSNFRYFVEGSSSSWITTLYDDANSTGSVNFYELRNNSAQKVMFTEGTVVYIAMDIGSGVLPPFTNISTNEILEAANHTVNGEQVLCYKIVVSQDGNWYTCQNEVNHTITTPVDETGDLFNIYDKRGNTLLQNAQIRDGDSYTFRISSNIKKSNILDLFEKQSDGSYLVKEGKTPFEIVGADYTYYTNKLGNDNFLYIYITLNDVRDDVTVSVNLETRKADFAFKIEEGYSIYIDDTLVTGEAGETVLVSVTFKSVLTLVPDDGFIFIDINSRIVYYYMKDGVSTRYQSYALDVAKDNTHATYEFGPYSFYTPIDTSKPVEFLDVMLATHKADNVTQYCASADELNNITFPDGKPVGVNTDNSLIFSVKLPFGNYPVLFVEYANRLSDGYYTYQAVSSSQEGDYSLFTFEVTNIDSDVNWFLELRPNVYEVTVHYGDKTDTVTLTHGQILADCDALLTSFEGSFEGQNGLFKVVGWSSEEGGNANVILVAGPDDLWAVTEFVPYTVSFEGQGFTSLSEALKALDQNASGTLDVLWGSAQELKAGEYSIPSGVTLRLPYAQNSYGRKLADNATDSPSIFYADNSKGTVMLKVAEGATLTVCGTIDVGGIVGYKQSARPYQGQTSSDYSILQLDGSLDVVSGGVLDVNGYIVGNGTVTLLDGAKSKLPFIVKDYRGGTNSSNVYYENIAPFNVYEMPNIQTNYVIHYGASEMAYAMLVALDSYQEIMVEAIGTSGIIRLNQGGYVVKKTTQIDNPRYSEATKAYEPQKEFRTTLDVYGGGRDGAMALNLGITSITTEGVLLAIPYTYSSVTLHDGNYTLYNMYKIMPGATLKVTEDAKLVLAAETLDGKAYQGTIITYDESFAETYSGSGPLTSSKQLLYPVQPNGVAEGGKLVVNGTLEIRGRLGADVACEVKGAKILVYAPNSNLEVTSREAVHFDKGVFTVTYEQTSSATVNGSTNLQYGNLYTSGEGGVWV